MDTGLRRLGRYELQEHLGQGGMAEVWKAFDTQLQRYVAIKVLHPNLQNDPTFVSRFEREAQLIASLHHPNIVQVYDFQVLEPSAQEESLAYMVMDYVPGPTLAHYLRDTTHAGKFFSPVELLNLFTPLCLAIDYAHRQGMIHCDLKPANILLDERNRSQNIMGEPIISDFGISRLLTDPTISQQGTWSGTPAYISPEQVQSGHSDERSDIYSLSIILYEICTGTLPYHADSPFALALQHVNGSPIPPVQINPDILPAVAAVILKGLAKDPTQRFATASSLLTELAEALNLPVPPGVRQLANATEPLDEPTYVLSPPQQAPASPDPVPPSGRQAPRREVFAFLRGADRRILLLALIALLLVGSLAGILFSLPRTAAAPPQSGGMVYFLNSGQITPNGNAGITDEVQVDLSSLPAPAAGNAYYAWLLSDTKESDVQALLLGTLPVVSGKVHFLFRGDAAHANVLAHFSRFLVTEESASLHPVHPASDAWRYYGEVPQQPVPSDTVNHYSLLDHLRHLVSDDPTMRSHGLYGGLNLWLSRNTEKVLEYASAARDEKDPALVHRELLRALDYLDGQQYSKVDVPAGSPFMVDPLAGQVGLYTFDQQQPLPGLLTHIEMHLEGLADAPGATPAQQALAARLDQSTKVVQKELTQARLDAKQLVNMSGDQLASPAARTLLNDLYQQTNQAYGGQQNVKIGDVQNGVDYISAQLQHLAIIPVKPGKQG